jgi:hydroxyethylthiazole kinase
MIDFKKIITNLKKSAPVIHCITNYVTANDCANILLACGASPIMADDSNESGEITSSADGLSINIGTMHEYTLKSMLVSGKQANLDGKPVIFDPVGAGSSKFRTETAKTLMENINFSIVRSNISELKALNSLSHTAKGVDADCADKVTDENLYENMELIRQFSEKNKTVAAVTGEYDIISDGILCCAVKNGHSMMSRVTGTGCMLSVLTAAFAAANPDDIFSAAAAAVCTFGVCGELAYGNGIGSGTYKIRLIDEINFLNPEIIKEKAKYEIYRK